MQYLLVRQPGPLFHRRLANATFTCIPRRAGALRIQSVGFANEYLRGTSYGVRIHAHVCEYCHVPPVATRAQKMAGPHHLRARQTERQTDSLLVLNAPRCKDAKAQTWHAPVAVIGLFVNFYEALERRQTRHGRVGLYAAC